MSGKDSDTMGLDREACYAAMRSRDSRFDGRFFCGVASTGIYCRPVCRVKLPRQENCTFFPSAAAAESAGYRPCLRCRPELAPGLAPIDAGSRLALSAARVIERDAMADASLSELAGRLGVSDRHLRRVFLTQYGVAPVQYLQTQRLLLAKNLLTDTDLPVTEVAMSAGFGSIRRFNDLFKTSYRMAPGRFRKEAGAARPGADAVTLQLGYRPPYAWDRLISFLATRAVPGVEWVTPQAYRRTVVLERGGITRRGWLAVAPVPGRDALAVTVALTLLPVLPQVLARVRHLFDLSCEPEAVRERLAGMARLAPGLPVPGLRLPGCFDPFEMAVRAVLGQQITVRAAGTLATRLAHGFGEKIETPFPELNCSFPAPAVLCALEPPIEDRLGPLGIIGTRARALLALAQALCAGRLTLTPGAVPEREMATLLELPGFGPWTVNYIAMRALGWTDAFLETDYGVRKALEGRSPKQALELAREWSPWRAYATVNLWQRLG